MSLDHLIEIWKSDPDFFEQVCAWQVSPAVTSQEVPLPDSLSPILVRQLNQNGIFSLYSHQYTAWQAVENGENVVIASSTASGKTLAYNLPVLNTLLADSKARALYLFPTKALAHDQRETLHALSLAGINAELYDGDTASHHRPGIRQQARVLLTNPDMLHTGILPHHTRWEAFFRNLKYIIIDEVHIYRGVFGSHVANLMRRVKRITRFYGAHPQFILTSATIANPQELASRLIEAPVQLADNDGAPHGERHFIIYNPPVTNAELGLRRSLLLEATSITSRLLNHGVQAILFGRSRRSVEIMLTYLQQTVPQYKHAIRGYRSGYLPADRREIEMGLRNGLIRAVVATSALELGIDIGSLDASVLAGYPGTIASTRQQAGRSGRKQSTSLAILITSATALDQFLARNPAYLLGRSPEQALIQPDNLLILLSHIRCAAFELPFSAGDQFGQLDADLTRQFLDILTQENLLHHRQNKYFWVADQYPAANISLRSASPDIVTLRSRSNEGLQTIGHVDAASALWMVHPDAIYLHQGQSYQVVDLNLQQGTADLQLSDADYYTDPLSDTVLESPEPIRQKDSPGSHAVFGEIVVTTQVKGFRKLRWYSHEMLGAFPLSLPPSQLLTTAFWLSINPDTVQALQDEMLWSAAPNDYGPDWNRIRNQVRARDGYRCQACGAVEMQKSAHHVHHKQPFRSFTSREEANRLDNLITLCPNCHHKAEQVVRIRSGLSGLAYLLGSLAPLFLMCDPEDIGVVSDPQSEITAGQPMVAIYDRVPGGIGLSERLYELHPEWTAQALKAVQDCPCLDGCPACVGPAGENMAGGKKETIAILEKLLA
ncbi:MAG TPA: DEAD/DEAH box helicase [Anaerolineaceae bacterium]|nr:DEAD/DEAH box helicase [Anaerolineaceae bacterium]HPN50815.1 DEAD/DEAH box helicase [Anaerolineaceae bacterium]